MYLTLSKKTLLNPLEAIEYILPLLFFQFKTKQPNPRIFSRKEEVETYSLFLSRL